MWYGARGKKQTMHMCLDCLFNRNKIILRNLLLTVTAFFPSLIESKLGMAETIGLYWGLTEYAFSFELIFSYNVIFKNCFFTNI